VFFFLDVVPDCEAGRAAGDTADCRARERSAYGGSDNGSSGSAYTRWRVKAKKKDHSIR